jgi:hopanoid-associated phosphorylase
VSVTGIVAALTAEARTLGPCRSSGVPTNPDGFSINTLLNGTLLVVSGMGPAAATQAARMLVAAGAQGLLSFGLAGALDPALRAGALLLPQWVTDEAGQVHTTYEPWRERLAALAAARPDAQAVAPGTLLSVMRPLASAATKAQARRRTGACAVDMESFAIAQVAAEQSVKFAVVRVVVDAATDALPRSVTQATGSRGEVNVARLLGGLLRRPAELSILLQLSQRYRVARRSLQYFGRADLGLS